MKFFIEMLCHRIWDQKNDDKRYMVINLQSLRQDWEIKKEIRSENVKSKKKKVDGNYRKKDENDYKRWMT